MRAREVVPGIWRSPLPLAREIQEFAEMGGRSVVDLTNRPRPGVQRAAERAGMAYVKYPLPYANGDIRGAADVVQSAERPVLMHCFHGRDRTGRVARVLRMRTIGQVVLYRVGRNLDRALRTVSAFGVRRLVLVECNEAHLSGRRYGDSGMVDIVRRSEIPSGQGVVLLDLGRHPPIESVSWDEVGSLVLGGETSGLPRGDFGARVSIGAQELTVEAALAIGLHQWSL